MNNSYQNSQTHTHEFLGNTMILEMGHGAHNHRMAGISSEIIEVPGGHIHEIRGNTSFDDNHLHHVVVRTSLAIPVSNNKHVHFVKGATTVDDGHSHNFELATLN